MILIAEFKTKIIIYLWSESHFKDFGIVHFDTIKDDTIKLNQKWRICGTTDYIDDCCVHANSDRELAMTEKSMNNEQSE